MTKRSEYKKWVEIYTPIIVGALYILVGLLVESAVEAFDYVRGYAIFLVFGRPKLDDGRVFCWAMEHCPPRLAEKIRRITDWTKIIRPYSMGRFTLLFVLFLLGGTISLLFAVKDFDLISDLVNSYGRDHDKVNNLFEQHIKLMAIPLTFFVLLFHLYRLYFVNRLVYKGHEEELQFGIGSRVAVVLSAFVLSAISVWILLLGKFVSGTQSVGIVILFHSTTLVLTICGRRWLMEKPQ